MQRRYRVVVTPTGLDDHDHGARVLARALREAGFEVIVTAADPSARHLAAIVAQEDADAVGLTGLPSPTLELQSQLASRGAGDVVVFDHDPQGGSTADLVGWLGAVLDEREAPARRPA